MEVNLFYALFSVIVSFILGLNYKSLAYKEEDEYIEEYEEEPHRGEFKVFDLRRPQ